MSEFAIGFLVFAIILAVLSIYFLIVSFSDADAFAPFIISLIVSIFLFLIAFNTDNDKVVKKLITKAKPTEVIHSKYEVIVYFNKEMYRYDEAKQVALINDSTTFNFHWDVQKDGDTCFRFCEPILTEK